MGRSEHNAVGLMSGTSLDGLDIACCRFSERDSQWTYEIVHATTVGYNHDWKARLLAAPEMSGIELATLHREYGKFLGQSVASFLNETGFQPDFISSHGHTIFHQPASGLTFQAGAGAALAATTGLPAICDFRTLDVALGGQGAPLVPIGDQLLFPEYHFCLNLGGMANISYEENGERRAFDVCPANMLLNDLAAKVKRPYDDNGAIAATGKLDDVLLQKLDQLPFYGKKGPKSLGREEVELDFFPVLEAANATVPDKLNTVVEHIARQVALVTAGTADATLLVTGGGAHNGYLVERIRAATGIEVVVPESAVVNYKEALIFAFLGTLRWTGQINVLSSVTGASKNHVAGAIYAPSPQPE